VTLTAAAGPFRVSVGHASESSYAAYLDTLPVRPQWRATQLARRGRFVLRWPSLQAWFAEPLMVRVGCWPGRAFVSPAAGVSFRARSYLTFLALHHGVAMDWPWLIGSATLTVARSAHSGFTAGVGGLVDEATVLGYQQTRSEAVLWPIAARLALSLGSHDVGRLGEEALAGYALALTAFADQPEVAELFGSADAFAARSRLFAGHLHRLRVVLYHRGQLAQAPLLVKPRYAQRHVGSVPMEAAVVRYLAARKLDARPSTLAKLEIALRRFMGFLAGLPTPVASWSAVTREDALGFAAHLDQTTGYRSGHPLRVGQAGQPLSVLTKRSLLSAVSVFATDVAGWGWPDGPTRPLLGSGDLPKMPRRVPRYIPAHELDRLLTAIRGLTDPYHRAALLIARWSGARRDEIRRLDIDCLDSYPDGTPRLRLPAGKTRRERMIPVHPEAAEAITAVQADRHGERGFHDELSGTLTRRLFVHKGRPCSSYYLFDVSLAAACGAAGLVTANGRPTVTAHRFRHTVGTELADKGARLHTIMAVLGHTSPGMSMVYAQISDPEVLRDYKAVLGPGAVIAGPAAESLRDGRIGAEAVDWLTTNFLKTELELGHCLRLPAEGPCECDLYLSCAKFVTTPHYARRLRDRHRVEQTLIDDARQRGWEREVQRHQAIAGRIQTLLTELDEPLHNTDPTPACAESQITHARTNVDPFQEC